MTILGTRPEAIKLAPVIIALQQSSAFAPVVVVTAQHRQMLDQVLDLFGIQADHDLDIQRERQTLNGVTVRALAGLDQVMADRRPDAVIVQGDTTTTVAGALAAFYQQIPVAHLEAGLRTLDPRSPFPEEVNRRLTTQLASLHLAPTANNVANLKAEGVASEAIVCTGNTVIDALNYVAARKLGYDDNGLKGIADDRRRVVLVTAHRRESWGPAMAGIGRALARLAADPELLVVVPLHPNPVVRESIVPHVSHMDNVRLLEPLPYGRFVQLLDRSDLVLTDSGGIQEEAPSRGKPVLVMRDATERPEAIAAGTAVLVGTNEDSIFNTAKTVLNDSRLYEQMARSVNPYGDGDAARRTVEAVSWLLGLADRPDDFEPTGAPSDRHSSDRRSADK